MCYSRNDYIEQGDIFWAHDKCTGKKCDWTGPCVCVGVSSWAVYALDASECQREFLRHKFRFEWLDDMGDLE